MSLWRSLVLAHFQHDIGLTTMVEFWPRPSTEYSFHNFYFQFPNIWTILWVVFQQLLHISCYVYDSLWPVSLQHQRCVEVLAIPPLCDCCAVFVLVVGPLFMLQQFCYVAFPLRYTMCIESDICPAYSKTFSRFPYAGSAFHAFPRLFVIVSGLSTECTAYGHSWVLPAFQLWPLWLLLLFSSYCCRQIDACTRWGSDRTLRTRQSILIPVSTRLLGNVDLMGLVLSRSSFKHDASCDL